MTPTPIRTTGQTDYFRLVRIEELITDGVTELGYRRRGARIVAALTRAIRQLHA